MVDIDRCLRKLGKRVVGGVFMKKSVLFSLVRHFAAVTAGCRLWRRTDGGAKQKDMDKVFAQLAEQLTR